MAKEKEIVVINDIKKDMAINSEDISRLVGHLEMVKKVVSEVLREGIDGDYAVVPGTDKGDKKPVKALLKPGAEKLMKIFGLGVRFKQVENELDRSENFAMYSYEAEVYHLRTGINIATCEGTANSHEKKYKERSVYKGGVFAGREPTPVTDILNTLKKMAQKRAMVGAVILATAASDYFTQDEEEIEEQKPVKKTSTINADRFTGPAKDLGEYTVTVSGKFKGKKLSEIDKKDLSGYIESVTKNNPNVNGPLKDFIDNAREYLR